HHADRFLGARAGHHSSLMPAPQASVMQDLAKTQFRSFSVKVPNQPPLPAAFLAAATPGDRAVTPAPMPPALFLPDSPYTSHVKTQKHLTDVFGTYLDGVCSAVCSAWDQWQKAATLVGVVIAGPLASAGQVRSEEHTSELQSPC